MDQNVFANVIVINFILKGGPPWGFRIKQRGNKVIISKVNCGGRAYKNGLKINDEIVAVNNLEIDKHPLTLVRNVDESSPEDIENQSIKLTKLDFTYQLIKHTYNRQLHLTVRRYTDADSVQPCCYFIEDDGANEAYQTQHSQSEEEILSPGEEVDSESQQQHPHPHHHHHHHHHHPSAQHLPLITSCSLGLSQHQLQPPPRPPERPRHSLVSLGVQSDLSEGQLDQGQEEDEIREGERGQVDCGGHLPPEIPPLPPSPLHHLHHPHLYHYYLHHHHHLFHHPSHHPSDNNNNQRSSAIESPSGGSEFQLPCTPDSEDSDMNSVIKGPSYKAKAPKNIWSPGSTTTSSTSDLTSTPTGPTSGPMTMASATQTTPTRSESTMNNKCATLPPGFRPVKLSASSGNSRSFDAADSVNLTAAHDNNISTNITGGETIVSTGTTSGVTSASGMTTASGGDHSFVTPSSPSESAFQPESPVSPSSSGHLGPRRPRTPSEQSSDIPSVPDHPAPLPIDKKYWTLPRQSSSSSSRAGEGGGPSGIGPDDYYPRDHGITHIVTDKAPPRNAKLLYETPTAKYYTLPTSHSEVRSTVVPPPPKYDGIGPVNESGVPLSLRTGVKDEYASDWYKTMYKRLHRCDRPRSELDQPIRVKLKSSRSRDRLDPDYFSEDENTSRIHPLNIADYEPGRSSISLREKHKFYADLINYIDTIFSEVFSSNVQDSSSETNEDLVNRVINASQAEHRSRSLEDAHRRHAMQRSDLHHKNCVFNALTSPNGYESDSSYVIKKKERGSAPTPASRSTYCAIQRGDMDIPFSGLQKPAPAPRTHKESPHRFDEREVNIHYKTPIQTLVKGENNSFNEDDLSKFQREMMRSYSTNEYERRLNKETQRKHHFTPNQESIVHLDRYQKAYAQKDGFHQPLLLARVLFDFHALSSREISVKKGDIVLIHRPVNHNWVEVEDSQSGLKGLVPRNYLDYEQEGIAKAKYNFEAKTSVEISLKKGDVLKLIRKVDENWYEGVNQKGQIGIFPCSYVETLKTPLYLQLNNNNYRSSPSPCSTLTRGYSGHPLSPPRPVSPRRRLSEIPNQQQQKQQQQQQHHHVNGTTHSTTTTTTTTVPYRRDILLDELSTNVTGSKSKLYRVIYPYKPQQVDELELLPGDILTVTMHCDDGWFVGYSTLTGSYGTFPGNYVEPLM